MKIAILFASNQHGGKHEEIRQMIDSLGLPHKFDYIELADYNITHCKQNCPDCTIKKDYRCLDGDDTALIQNRLASADVNMIVVPLYYPYPSKFTALMEKLLNSCFRTVNRPLKGKPTAIFHYCSCKIIDDTPLRILWQQFCMDDGYSFTEPNYPFLNGAYSDALNQKYNRDVTEYIRDFILNLEAPNC